MFLARVEFGGDVRVYQLDDSSCSRKRAWRFRPHLGAEGNKQPSGLCNGGWAAIAVSAPLAVHFVSELRASNGGVK